MRLMQHGPGTPVRAHSTPHTQNLARASFTRGMARDAWPCMAWHACELIAPLLQAGTRVSVCSHFAHGSGMAWHWQGSSVAGYQCVHTSPTALESRGSCP